MAFGPRTLLALPFAWVLLEALRTQGPLAFPWGAPGYALTQTPLAQLASVGGVSLLTLLVTGTASVLASPGGGRPPVLLAGLAVWGAGLVWGRQVTPPLRPLPAPPCSCREPSIRASRPGGVPSTSSGSTST